MSRIICIDICGWKRPQSYYRDAYWNTENLTIAVHPPVSSFELPQSSREEWSRWHYDDIVFDWNWEGYEGKPIEVDIYTSCDEIELFLNSKSLGKKTVGKSNKNKVTYTFPYEKGELKATGYQNGKKIEDRLVTSGKATQLKLVVDRTTITADGQDLCYVTIELQDANGTPNPKAEHLLRFSLQGNGTIIAVGNANPKSLESYTLPQRKAWRGKCMVVIRADQKEDIFTLHVNGENLPESYLKINTRK